MSDIPDWYFGNIPDYMREGIMRYVQHGILPGSFGTAVLENNFYMASGAADENNYRQIRDWHDCLTMLPLECWGSKEKVQKWVAHRGLDGLEKDNE